MTKLTWATFIVVNSEVNHGPENVENIRMWLTCLMKFIYDCFIMKTAPGNQLTANNPTAGVIVVNANTSSVYSID